MPVHALPVNRLPLPFRRGVALVDRDPATMARRLRSSLAVLELGPVETSRPFLHRTTSLRLGAMGLHAVAHSALRAVNGQQAEAVVSLPLAGEKRFHVAGRTWLCRAGEGGLYLPGEAYSLDASAASGVILTVAPERLAAAAAALAGRPEGEFRPIQRPVPLREDDPRQGHLLGLLRRALALIDRVRPEPGGRLPAGLGLEDLIERLLALLLHPSLAQLETPDASVEPADRRAFARLREAVQADPLLDPLAHPWTLASMERFSGLPPARLQAVCREQLGCDPHHWLSQLRLGRARRALAGGLQAGDLPQLARRCGFAGVADFRRAFEARFQLDPMRLLLLDAAEGSSG